MISENPAKIYVIEYKIVSDAQWLGPKEKGDPKNRADLL
jgi:hypothetical protein